MNEFRRQISVMLKLILSPTFGFSYNVRYVTRTIVDLLLTCSVGRLRNHHELEVEPPREHFSAGITMVAFAQCHIGGERLHYCARRLK